MLSAIWLDWNQFWFARQSKSIQISLAGLRVLLAAVTLLWWISLWLELPIWFGSNGVLQTSMTAQFIEYEELSRWQVWSPLWWSDSLIVYQLYVAISCCSAAAAAIGLGGRWTVLLSIATIIGMANRMSWLIGPTEPALIAFWLYFLVEPGPKLFHRDSAPDQDHVLTGTTMRLLQCHFWILIAAGMAMQFEGLKWWRGEAVWWLAASGRSTLFTAEGLIEYPLWINAITHGFILLQIVTLWLLVIPGARWIGLVTGLLTCLFLALVADYWLYSAVLFVGLSAYFPLVQISLQQRRKQFPATTA